MSATVTQIEKGVTITELIVIQISFPGEFLKEIRQKVEMEFSTVEWTEKAFLGNGQVVCVLKLPDTKTRSDLSAFLIDYASANSLPHKQA